ncbi:MAG TPA: radical SAM protein, partial [Candidatus Woesearchaeota archaeon]|nr:radical SAM protein [Candidatus Woesearchaeota archaeon]
NKCNSLCNFCADSLKVRAHKELEPAEIISAIEKEKRDGTKRLLITGGEPTISPHLIAALKRGRELGFETINITTNARRLGDKEYFDKVNGYIDVYIVSFFSANPLVFDKISGVKGAFAEASRALLNIAKSEGKTLCINCVLSRLNYREMESILAYLYSLNAKSVQFSFANIVGFFRENFEELFADYHEIIPYAVSAVKLANYLGYKGLNFENFPICTFSGHIPLKEIMPMISDLHHPEGNKEYYSSGKVHTKKCEGCFFLNRCEGIYEEYYRRKGDNALRTIKEEDLEGQKEESESEKD